MLVAVSTTITSGAGATTPPVVTITSEPVAGATGTIQVDIDELDSTEEIEITFAVKVDS